MASRALTGAWIETAVWCDQVGDRVAPSRARGLKQSRIDDKAKEFDVAPSRARGLKQQRIPRKLELNTGEWIEQVKYSQAMDVRRQIRRGSALLGRA